MHVPIHEGHWRRLAGTDAPLASIGIGTFLGDADDATDALYEDSVARAVRGGINVIDTAINYRSMRSERAVGRALRRLAAEGLERGAVLLASKGGFVPWDSEDGRPKQRYVHQTYVADGDLHPDAAHRGHSVRPAFIRRLLAQSLDNLGVQTLDVYFLHNPERELEVLGPDRFYPMLRRTFEVLEEARAAGRIGWYGCATWGGLRVPPGAKGHLALEEVARAAGEAAGGADHGFAAVQLPLNPAMPEALLRPTQRLGGRLVTALEAARGLGLYAFTSAAVNRGAALGPAGAKLAPDAAAALLQLARSAPGVGTALAGMRRAAHVDTALAVAREAPLPGGSVLARMAAGR